MTRGPPVPALGSSSKTKENGNGNAGGNDALWDAWDDPPTKKAAPSPRRNSRSCRPNIVTQPPPNRNRHPRASTPITPLRQRLRCHRQVPGHHRVRSPESQQIQSNPPTPASITMRPKAPKEFYSASSGMQDILELVEGVMLESSEFSRSTLLAASIPAPDSALSILSTVPSTLDLFRALYPMTLGLGHETEDGFLRVLERAPPRDLRRAFSSRTIVFTLKNGSGNYFLLRRRGRVTHTQRFLQTSG